MASITEAGNADVDTPTSSFPNIGVSLQALRDVRDDPRMQEPMVRLVRPDLAPAEVEALRVPELCELAKEIRVLSHLEGNDEFARYKPTWERSRWTKTVDAEGTVKYQKFYSPAVARLREQQLEQKFGKAREIGGLKGAGGYGLYSECLSVWVACIVYDNDCFKHFLLCIL